MKPIRLLLLFALIVSGIELNAQKPVKVYEDSLLFGNAKIPGFSVTIPEVNYEVTQKSWIKELERGTKSKVTTDNNGLSIFGALIKGISPAPLNVYSKLYNRDTLLLLCVSFEVKKDTYIERPNGDADMTKAMAFLKQFAKEQYLGFVKDELNTEEKKLNQLEKELNSLGKGKTKMQKSIQSNRSDITSEKDNIVIQNNELTRLTNEILVQNTQMGEMEEGVAKEEKASYIKELEKTKKKTLKAIETSEKRISKANSEINEADRNIPRNESEQGTLEGKIMEQQSVVDRFTEKYNKVKAY